MLFQRLSSGHKRMPLEARATQFWFTCHEKESVTA